MDAIDVLTVVVLGLLGIAAASSLGSRLGVAAPLLLVVAGIAVSGLPFVPAIEIEPEWILAGVLPPLLYSASVSMPTVAFRRDFGAIGGLSVVLVVVSTVLLGLFFAWAIPDLGLAWGIALGAIMSPTDAVATSIVRRIGVTPRVVTVLEGESLLNDATALVLLRAAIAGAAASVSLWEVGGRFIYVVAVAVLIGMVVGHLNLLVRARVTEPRVNTVISFTVPFLASIPAEHLGASGLVAAVAAGLATSQHAPERLSPGHRLSDSQNWRAIELILESGVFLVMGLQLSAIVGDVRSDHEGIGNAALIAAGALVLTIAIRAAYLVPLLGFLRMQAHRGLAAKAWLAGVEDRLDAGPPDPAEQKGPRLLRRSWTPEMVERMRWRLRTRLADIDYLLATPLGWREGSVIVWSGMRGAVTLAAAQTLPEDTPNRPVLILIAFLVATGSLLLQGGTLGWLTGRVRPATVDPAIEIAERAEVLKLLREAAGTVLPGFGAGDRTAPDGTPAPPLVRPTKPLMLAAIAAQRRAVLDARDDGRFSAEVLEGALRSLDADQISLELRGSPGEG